MFPRISTTLLLISLVSSSLVSAKEDIVLNADGRTYDSHPSAVITDDGGMWIAWHGYRDNRDSVLARRVSSEGQLGEFHTISTQGRVHGPPHLAVDAPGSAWVVWSSMQNGRWRILARRFAENTWRPIVALSPGEKDAIYPHAQALAKGKLLVAWSQCAGKRFEIAYRRWQNGAWEETVHWPDNTNDAYRPQVAVEKNGRAVMVWDQYGGNRYRVASRQVLPKAGALEFVSPPSEHCLTPIVLATRRGLCAAWLRKVDVIGGPGVISQMHTLHMSVWRNEGWKLVRDAKGGDVAAELTQGLMAKIEPRPVATGGYLGRRTRPMLLEHGDQVWLLWERKADHRGRTPFVVGDLLGRPMRRGTWRKPVLLHHGRVDYHLPRQSVARLSKSSLGEGDSRLGESCNRFVMLASQLPRHNRRIYHRIMGDLSASSEFKQQVWRGWRPVDLPIQEELTPRREIRMGDKSCAARCDKTYKLYWADLHCHNGLTADAEGEPDELIHYARDRARLDVVVFTNNDFLYDVPLTQYEYQLGNLLAKVYGREPSFLSLPGYEWTSRLPRRAGVKVSDRGNWTQPYKHPTYPNHRTVIYPVSGGPLVPFPEVGNDVRRLNEAVERAGGITTTQHDAFQISGHRVEVAMELTSGWRNYIQRVPELFHGPLNRGVRLGFVACGDTHRRAPGLSGALTGIFAEKLTADSILAALRQRRCYATGGARIFLDSRAGGDLMGRDTRSPDGAVKLTLHAIGTRPIVKVELIRDGHLAKTFSGNVGLERQITHHEKELAPGLHWYYWRVTQQRAAPDLPGNLMAAHGHLAWSSPHWVIVE